MEKIIKKFGDFENALLDCVDNHRYTMYMTLVKLRESIHDEAVQIERDRFETNEKIEKLKAALEDEKKRREEAEKKLADVYAFAKIAQKQGGAFSWGFNGLEDSK